MDIHLPSLKLTEKTPLKIVGLEAYLRFGIAYFQRLLLLVSGCFREGKYMIIL